MFFLCNKLLIWFFQSTSTFKALFEFLAQFIMPDYTLQVNQNNPLEKVLPELLKQLKYPGPLNKSHFQTIGGNNISKNLGVLHFLLTLAKLSLGVYDDFSKVNWPNTDPEGFPVSDASLKSEMEIQHNFFIKAYHAYNNGSDEFDQEVEDMYWDLMDSKQVNEEVIAQLEEEMIQLEKIHRSLVEPSNEIDELNIVSGKLLEDLKKLQDYLEQAQKHFASKQTQLKTVQENVKKLSTSNDELKQSILMLESECLAKNIGKYFIRSWKCVSPEQYFVKSTLYVASRCVGWEWIPVIISWK